MVAETGMYRVEGDRYITKWDVAWYPGVVGAETVSSFRFEGNRLHVIGDWTPATIAGKTGIMGRAIMTWERAN
jgi:Lipocalin-like domain